MALNLKVISKKALETVVVDSTVQPKAIAHPTDSRLLEVARQKLVVVAKDAGISLKQTFGKEGKQLTRKAGGYAHARQFRRMRKPINRQRTIVAKLARQIERLMASLVDDMKHTINEALHKAQRLVTQTKHRKTKGIPKLYSWHAPEVEVIAKGKARTPYEFGVKVGITSTLKGNLILGARTSRTIRTMASPWLSNSSRPAFWQTARSKTCTSTLATAGWTNRTPMSASNTVASTSD